VALSFEGRTLTYAELDVRANQVAHHLRGLGVGAGDRVGLCVERSLELVVGILGILKAGAAYLPLDPEYPQARLAFMLEDARAPVLLTQSWLEGKLPEHAARVVCLDRDWAAIAAESDTRLSVEGTATDLAYVIYTSGSTGTPKGTAISHRSVVRLVQNTDFVELGPEQVFLQFAAISFDASTFELWGSLLHGARLVIFPARIPSLEELGEVIRSEGITTLWLTAALFHQMVDEQLESLGGVEQLLAGGDALSVPHVRRYLATLAGDRRLINGYGPTENTTFTCCHVMRGDTEIDGTVPIGRPIRNTTVYLLDAQGQPVPVGVAGELCTGGDGLAREYWNQPELTAEKFVPDPFSSEAGGRLYRTGDRARYRADGVIEFLGRVDHQVKIRGFRVELGEIEAALRAHEAVGDAVVMTREDAPGDRRLVAWVAAGEGAGPSPSELRGFVRERLPEYMVPAVFVMLERLPLNANGKVDRSALPDPEGERQTDQAYVAPRSELEQQIAAVWREVLRLDEVGIDDNFFDLGGNSLLLMRVHGQLSRFLPREVSIVELFRLPTTRALARSCHENASDPREAGSSREKIHERASRQRNALARRKQRREEERDHE
jgi:aspartate racemase